MTDRNAAGQAGERHRIGIVVTDEAHMALLIKALAVEGDDAGCFLSAMLKRMQAKRRERGGIGMSQNSENPAFFMQRISVERMVGREGMGLVHFCGPLLSQEWIGISRNS
jgi:hypothetical protein